jgi:hypothetical protein
MKTWLRRRVESTRLVRPVSPPRRFATIAAIRNTPLGIECRVPPDERWRVLLPGAGQRQFLQLLIELRIEVRGAVELRLPLDGETTPGQVDAIRKGLRVFLSFWAQPAGDALLDRMQQEHAEELLDLARRGDEDTFRDLALCVGVQTEALDGLWQGLRERVGSRRELVRSR